MDIKDKLRQLAQRLAEETKDCIDIDELEDIVFGPEELTGHAKDCPGCRDLILRERERNPFYRAQGTSRSPKGG